MKTTPRVKRLFSPFIIIYCLCVVLVVAFIIYIAFNKTIITVILKQTPQQYSFNYTAEAVHGVELSLPLEHSYTYTAYEATEEVGTARGTVTIINNYSAAQPLVATTRLLSEDGVLFRTDETVTVPAGGRVTVPVYADQAGASGNIGPTKFEIVALWDGLKDNIYAESDVSMTGGVIKRVTMTEAIAEQAKTEALAEAKAAALALLQEEAAATLQKMSTDDRESYQRFLGSATDVTEAMQLTADQVIFSDVTQTVTPAVGSTGDTVVVTTTGNTYTFLYTLNNVLNQITADTQHTPVVSDLTLALNTDHQLVGSIQLPQTQATLDFIDTASLTSKTAQQLEEQLLAYDQVASVEIHLSPIWATRSPALEQQIQLQLSSQP